MIIQYCIDSIEILVEDDYKKKGPEVLPSRLLFNLAVPTFPVRHQTSIIGVVDLTSVFGMGTGVSLQLYPPEIF